MTIMGKHTVNETRDLRDLLEYRIDQTNTAYRKLTGALVDAAARHDPTLRADWDAFLTRWITARDKANSDITWMILKAPLVPGDVQVAEEQYQALLKAESPTNPSYTDKDLPGLMQRIQALMPNNPIDYSGQPKANAGDLDLKAYQAANATADAVTTAGQKGEDFLSDNKGKIALAVMGGVATLVVLKKVGLL